MTNRVPCFLSLAALVASTTSLAAQCANAWQSFGALPGVNYTGDAVSNWDPDGAGPLSPCVVVAGSFGLAGGAVASQVAAWDPATGAWSALGAGIAGQQTRVYVLLSLPNGGLIAGGQFTTAGGLLASNIARWSGTAWSPLGAGLNAAVRTLHVLPNGDVVAAGDFWLPGGTPGSGIARWNGTSWSAIGTGVQAYSPGVCAIAALPNGDLFVGGAIVSAGGQPSPNLARLTTTCPATVLSTGLGCAGDTVTATLPWTGSTWRADASGLPSSAIVFAVNGFAPASLPLAAMFATALPGCTLRVSPDAVDLITGANGAATFQFVLPNTPSLAGITFHHQMIPLALDATLAVTATNSLQLTVGSF